VRSTRKSSILWREWFAKTTLGWCVTVLFCLNAGDNTLGGYYDSGNPTNSDIVKGLPTDVELVFWSYYHSVPERYAQKIYEHWQFAQRAPWMASGIWTWSRYVKKLLLRGCGEPQHPLPFFTPPPTDESG
jgi:hypothetical protein